MSNATSSSTASANTGMGVVGWLTIVFIVLKLNPGGYLTSPVVDWSWWLVFSPILSVLGIIFALLLFAGMAFGASSLIDRHKRNKRKKDAKATANMTPGERREYYANKRRR